MSDARRLLDAAVGERAVDIDIDADVGAFRRQVVGKEAGSGGCDQILEDSDGQPGDAAETVVVGHEQVVTDGQGSGGVQGVRSAELGACGPKPGGTKSSDQEEAQCDADLGFRLERAKGIEPS